MATATSTSQLLSLLPAPAVAAPPALPDYATQSALAMPTATSSVTAQLPAT